MVNIGVYVLVTLCASALLAAPLVKGGDRIDASIGGRSCYSVSKSVSKKVEE